jgi:thymidylate synthase ThyX
MSNDYKITAKVIADSISITGNRITTFELEYQRYIHSEFMTHRLFSRNAASSRAIPISKMLKQVELTPAMPVEFGKDQSGMQAKEVMTGWEKATARWAWKNAAKKCVQYATTLKLTGVHKQLVNRLLEPFQTMKTVVTATEYDNWYWLRDHPDAQPEIRVLAQCMLKAQNDSTPKILQAGEWHLPYASNYIEDGLTLEEAKKVSASCCAQVSYRTLNQTLKVALSIYDKLVTSTPVHASPFEHCATPIKVHTFNGLMSDACDWPEGVTHVDRKGNLWSGNFKGWIQYRQLIPHNTYYGPEQ